MGRRHYFFPVAVSGSLTPTVTSFLPVSGPVATSVAITGTNFANVSAVTFNGVSASGFVVNSATQITVSVPPGASTGFVAVTTANGTGTSTGAFGVTVAAPSGAQLVLEGDQQLVGMAALIQAARPAFGTVADNTVAGQSVTSLASGFRARLQAARNPQKPRHFCLLYVGAVDIAAGRTASAIEIDLRTIGIICQQEGYELLVPSLTSLRSAAFGTGSQPTAFDGVRSAEASRLRLYGTTTNGINAAAVIDLASIPELGQFASGLNTDYFTDGQQWTTSAKNLVLAFIQQAFTRLLAGESAVVVTNAPVFAQFASVVGATVTGGTITNTAGTWGTSGAVVALGIGPSPAGTAPGTLRGASECVYAGPEGGYFLRVSESQADYTNYHTGFAGLLTDAASITPFGNDAALGAGIATNDTLLRTMRIAVDDTNVVLTVAGNVLKTQALTNSQKNSPLYILIGLSVGGAKVNDLTFYALNPVDLAGNPINPSSSTSSAAASDAANVFPFTPESGTAADYGWQVNP